MSRRRRPSRSGCRRRASAGASREEVMGEAFRTEMRAIGRAGSGSSTIGRVQAAARRGCRRLPEAHPRAAARLRSLPASRAGSRAARRCAIEPGSHCAGVKPHFARPRGCPPAGRLCGARGSGSGPCADDPGDCDLSLRWRPSPSATAFERVEHGGLSRHRPRRGSRFFQVVARPSLALAGIFR